MPNKRLVNRRRRRPAVSKIEHLRSSVIRTLDLKTSHLREEVYPIDLKDLISRANVGSDSDVRLVGYNCKLTFASGNKLSTVSVSLGHSGPWVRPSNSTDGYNQQFVDRFLGPEGEVSFHKRSLLQSERQFNDPDIGGNYINFRIRDPCGVVPGVTVLINFTAFLTRRVIDTTFNGASELATDRYEDQDVSTGSPSPPSQKSEVPQFIFVREDIELYNLDENQPESFKEAKYTSTDDPKRTAVIDTTPILFKDLSKTGSFQPKAIPGADREYQKSGYLGTITFKTAP